MAELTMAFAHDAAAAAVAEETALAKWPTGWTLAFVISTSAALWTTIKRSRLFHLTNKLG